MMSCPASYVELELKGKSPEAICAKIRGMQREMSHLKNQEETYKEFEDVIVSPSPQVRIDMMRDYINEARAYLAELGQDYPLSKTELRGRAFDENMKFIESIAVEYGGFFGGFETRKITHDGDKIVVAEKLFFNGILDDDKPLYEGMSWSGLLEDLSVIHMGEWKTKYEDLSILDGTQWSVDIEYSNGIKKKHYWGSNKFPYNFGRFMEIMEMER